MKIADIINNIDSGALALPVFQRGYVWKRRQVRDLMNSLYNKYPIGSLLIWTTRVDQVEVRGGHERTSGTVNILLDGQQRVTSLYGLMQGKAPQFFDGDDSAFTGLYFNLATENFEYLSERKANTDPLWINVADLFDSNRKWVQLIIDNPALQEYLGNGMKVDQIKDIDIPMQEITGNDKTTDVVVDIFNRVNSGGTKLSKGDLALARIGAHWPLVREEMQQRLSKWENAGFRASLDWLLRCMTAIITGSAEFERLEMERIDPERVKDALQLTENAGDYLLEAMRSHLHMDIDRVYNSKAAFPVMVKYVVNNNGRLHDLATLARLLHWYISVAIWGRYSGPTETVTNQDLAALSDANPIEALLMNLRLSQGERAITHENFNLNYTRARFYPLLYIMSRIQDARDWGTGNRLRHHSLGESTNLERHHIFPKAYLVQNGVEAKDANNMGNIAFQTRETNRVLGKTPPEQYMPRVAANWPGALESQWIPTEDPELWKVENYQEFLYARRSLLAEAASNMLAELGSGRMPTVERHTVMERLQAPIPTTAAFADPDDKDMILDGAEQFTEEHGLPTGRRAHEIYDEERGKIIATLDLAWPEGLQVGYSQPVALVPYEDIAEMQAASNAGFKVFTSLDDFRHYVAHSILDEGA